MIRTDEKGSSTMKALLGVLGIIVVAGGGFFAYTTYFAGPDIPVYTPPPPLPESPQPPQAEVVPPAPTPDATATQEAVPPVTDPNAAPVTPPAETAAATPTEPAAPVAPAASMPAPPTEQLQPISPSVPETMIEKAQAIHDQTTAPLPSDPTAPVPTAMQKKTADTVQAVNDILGEPAIVTPEAQKAMAKTVEVTPRASEVIVVKKTYSANSGPAVNAAGERVLQAGQYNDAVQIFDKQLAKNPSDPAALSGKALALQQAGKTQEAMDAYDRLLDLNPRDVDALTNYLGLLQKQNPEQALSRLQGLEQQYPDNAAVAGQLGMVEARLMDTPNALRSFQKAAALDPTNAVYPFNMGVLYDRLGTVEKAREAYRMALSAARSYPEKAESVPLESIRHRLQGMATQ